MLALYMILFSGWYLEGAATTKSKMLYVFLYFLLYLSLIVRVFAEIELQPYTNVDKPIIIHQKSYVHKNMAYMSCRQIMPIMKERITNIGNAK